MSLSTWLTECEGRTLRTLEGERGVLLRPPPAPEALAAYTARLPLRLSGSYADLLPMADGLDYFGVPVFGVTLPEDTDPDAVAELLRRRLVPFHDWGQGDFDCLDLTKAVGGEVPVALWSEELDNPFPITHSFEKWLRQVAVEVELYGRLLHPRDYADPRWANAQGVYESIANVKRAFQGQDGPEVGRSVTPVRTAEPPPAGGLADRVFRRVRRVLGRG